MEWHASVQVEERRKEGKYLVHFISGVMRLALPFLVLGIISFIPNYLSGQDLPFDSSIVRGKLDNGLSYFIKKNKKPENRAELRLVVDAGSLLEEDHQQGLAHFVEHMAFNGTQHFAKNDLVDFLELTGTRFGADLNAYTSFDETVYKLQVRTDSLDLLDKGLLILADWAQGITFDSLEIEKERGVVLSEWRTRLSPDDRLQRAYFPVIYKDSRFAERFPIGQPEIIETAPAAVIKQFYQDWYRTDLMAVVAVGDFDLMAMEEKIIQQFQGLKPHPKPRERSRFTIPTYAATRTLLATDEEAPFTQVFFQIQHPGRQKKGLADYKLNLLISLYNRMLGARLYELQQTQNPAFTFASSSYSSSLGDKDAYSVTAFVSPQKLEAGFATVYEETKRAINFGFTSTELERQIKELLSAAEKNYQERNDQASARFAGNLVYHFLDNNPVLSAEQYLALLQTITAAIKVEEINTLAKGFLKKEGRSLAITGPKKDSLLLPQPEKLLAIIDSIDQLELTPYIDEVPLNSIFDFSLPPGQISKERYFEDFDVTELQLSNGVKVVLKPTDFKADEIMLSAISPGGHSLVPDSLYQSAIAAITLSSLSGLADINAPQLQKSLAGMQVGVGPYINEFYEGLSGRSTKVDLEKLFQLSYLYFKAPRFEEAALAGHLQRQENILENITINPYYYFGALQSAIKYQGHPRRKGIPSMDDLLEISVDEAEQFYKDRFADASDFTFFLVGDFEIPSIKPFIQSYLGNLPSINRVEHFRDIGARLASSIVDTVVYKGQAPKALVDITFHGDFDYNSDNRYLMSSMLSVLKIRLREKLREELGGVYGVNVSGFNSPRPQPYYRIGIRFTAEPEMADTLIATTFAIIKDIQDGNINPVDIEKVKETQIQSRLKSEKENNYWMAQLTYRYREGLPLDGAATEYFKARIDNLSATSIQRTAKNYFNWKQYLKLVLMPE